jgi:uncharacterized phage-associated protein
MRSAIDVANVFLKLSQPEVGDTISNLKLQKLLYYAQGFHLALYNKPLFDDDIKSWDYGPVVENAYHQYKCFGSGPIPVPEDIDLSMFSEDQLDLLAEVNEIYGQYSALKLMHLTHSEQPWIETPRNSIIAPKLLRDFFLTRINTDMPN